jgi:triacylglycerol esterase/lipase EstA (alpha/beta hydrolase family)
LRDAWPNGKRNVDPTSMDSEPIVLVDGARGAEYDISGVRDLLRVLGLLTGVRAWYKIKDCVY